jgi:uncharacterized protein (TIGR04255 family)
MFDIANLKYDNPPLIELVMGARFAKLAALKLPHIGLFWHSIRDVFTRCEHAPPYAPDGTQGEMIDPNTSLPLPRIWLINAMDDHLIQLQPNMFLFNWRKDGQEYPHFAQIKPMFEMYFALFKQFVLENQIGDIQPTGYELTYVDQIPSGEGWSRISDIGKVFPALQDIADDHRMGADLMSLQVQTVYQIPGDLGALTIKVNTARRVADQKEVVILDMTARSGGTAFHAMEMLQWFDGAHSFIKKVFVELCGEEIQIKYWKRRD